jgi:hypothetical protein
MEGNSKRTTPGKIDGYEEEVSVAMVLLISRHRVAGGRLEDLLKTYWQYNDVAPPKFLTTRTWNLR